MRKAGRTFAELKKMASGFQDEIRKGFDEPSAELRKTAETIREAATVPGVTTRAKPSAKMAAATTASEAASYPDKPQHNPEVDAIPDLPPGNSVAPAATAAAAVGLAGAATDGDTPDAGDDTTDAGGDTTDAVDDTTDAADEGAAAPTVEARHGADDMATDAAEPMPDAPVAGGSADVSDDLVDTDDEAAAVGPDLGA